MRCWLVVVYFTRFDVIDKSKQSYWVWGHKHALKAQLFPKDLPVLYDAGAGCEVIRDDVDGRLRFCEDGVVVAPGMQPHWMTPPHTLTWPNEGVSVFSCDPGRHKWNTVMVRILSAYQQTTLIFHAGPNT